MKLKIVLGVLAILLVACTSPPADIAKAEVHEDALDAGPEVTVDGKVAVDKSVSSFEYEGYGPGKSHIGTFNEWDGYLMYENGQIVGAEGIIQASSVDTGIGGLDSHLQTDDFFDVSVYPTIEFSSTSISNGVMTGTLNFHGVEKTVSFPVQVTEDGITADFLLDTTDFNIKYTGIDKDVRIFFVMMV